LVNFAKGNAGKVADKLADVQPELLTERRAHSPWGLAGGEAGQPGENWRNDQRLPAKCSFDMRPGERLILNTPGGGGWGASTESSG